MTLDLYSLRDSAWTLLRNNPETLCVLMAKLYCSNPSRWENQKVRLEHHMPIPGDRGSICHYRYSSFFLLFQLKKKKLSMESNWSLESAKACHGEENMKSVALGCVDSFMTMPHEIKSNAFLSSLALYD